RFGRETDAAALVRAGLADALAPDSLARMRAGLIGAGLLLSSSIAVLAPSAAVVIPLATGGGLAAPGRWITRRAAARRAALVRELPDLLDLLGICIEAGMALDPALRLAAERLGGTLGREISTVLRDLSLGAARRDAYQGLVDRAGAPEMTRTIGALLQAEELGAPLSRALQGQAESLRASRRQDARERAARAAPKIQLVVAMVMVPAVLLLVLGVLVIELSRQVGAVIG
ncbi:MAG: type II secretion system F family protein, partial [Thermoleophilia bacterium]|nr:type II secretion system F family protein [Thermoleophilia bacterium]